MAHYIQSTSPPSGVEGCVDNYNAVDLSKFKEISAGLKSLQMFDLYFTVFVQNNVDDAAVVCLEKDDVKDLISKIGDRARFMKWLNAYKNTQPTPKTNEMKEETKVAIKQTCSVCNGNKQVKQTETYLDNTQCHQCGGNGTRHVTKYNTREVTCSSCNGQGSCKIKCAEGRYGCPYKNPNIKDPYCDLCHGRQWTQCYTCKGSRTVKQQSSYSSTEPCYGCNGRGVLQQNKTRDKMVVCTACNGQGQY
eukprot:35686_1